MSLTKYASRTEQRIASKLITDVLAAGHSISVHDGEAFALEHSRDASAIKQAMASSDHDTLVVRDTDGQQLGWVLLIYGNGEDLVSDHRDTDAMRALLAGAEAIANR